MILKAKLDDLVHVINRWNSDYSQGLSFQGVHGDKAAWGRPGNNCFLALTELDPRPEKALTRIEYPTADGQKMDDKAHTFWHRKFLPMLRNRFFDALDPRDYPMGELGRIAERGLSAIPAWAPAASPWRV